MLKAVEAAPATAPALTLLARSLPATLAPRYVIYSSRRVGMGCTPHAPPTPTNNPTTHTRPHLSITCPRHPPRQQAAAPHRQAAAAEPAPGLLDAVGPRAPPGTPPFPPPQIPAFSLRLPLPLLLITTGTVASPPGSPQKQHITTQHNTKTDPRPRLSEGPRQARPEPAGVATRDFADPGGHWAVRRREPGDTGPAGADAVGGGRGGRGRDGGGGWGVKGKTRDCKERMGTERRRDWLFWFVRHKTLRCRIAHSMLLSSYYSTNPLTPPPPPGKSAPAPFAAPATDGA